MSKHDYRPPCWFWSRSFFVTQNNLKLGYYHPDRVLARRNCFKFRCVLYLLWSLFERRGIHTAVAAFRSQRSLFHVLSSASVALIVKPFAEELCFRIRSTLRFLTMGAYCHPSRDRTIIRLIPFLVLWTKWQLFASSWRGDLTLSLREKWLFSISFRKSFLLQSIGGTEKNKMHEN